MVVYLEGPRAQAQLIEAYAKELEAAGYRVFSTWHRVPTITRIHQEFITIGRCDLLILFSSNEASAWIKVGFAAGIGCRLIAIGKLPSSATDLFPLRVDTWADLKLDNFSKLGDIKWKRPGATRTNAGHVHCDAKKASKRARGIAGKMKEKGLW
jgi:hypothetical protein